MTTPDVAVPDELLARWRADTPGCVVRAHLNNAGAALMPASVVNAIHTHTDLEATIGGYEAADDRAADIDRVYTDIARLINCDARNVAITGSATASFVQAITTVDFQPGDVIVTSRADYTSYQIHMLALSKRLGVRVVHARDLPEGGIDVDDLRRILSTTRARFVTVSWMPTHGGLIQDVRAVGDVCEEFGVTLHVDACQVAGQMPIDMQRLRCDYLSATGRKFLRGPRGIGFLYASDRALGRGDYPMFIDMRGAEWTASNDFTIAPTARRFEDWEFAYALVLGFGAAVRYAMNVGPIGGTRAMALAAEVRTRLMEVDGVRILDTGRAQSAIVTFDHRAIPASDFVAALAREGINTVISRRWYGMLDFTERGVDAAVRVSPHYYNTTEEIERLVAVVAATAREKT